MGKNKNKGKAKAASEKSGEGTSKKEEHGAGEGSSQKSQQQGPPQQQRPPQQEQPQGAWGGRAQQQGPPQQQRPPQQEQPQGAWGGRAQQQRPPQQEQPQGAWGGRGQQQRPPQQEQPQGAWGGRAQQQGLPQQQGPPQQLRPPQQEQPQGAWGGRGQQQRPPQQEQPQGAWGGRAQQQRPPQQEQPQGAWGGKGQQQGPPQQQHGPWGDRGEQRGPPQQQQGAWGDRGQQQRPPQQEQPQGAWGGRGQQQGPPQQQHGPWGDRGQQRGPPQQQQPPPGGRSEQQGAPEQPRKAQSGSSQLAVSELQFAPRRHAEKKSGRPIVVATNFFGILVKNPNLVVYHYNVVIEPDKPKNLLRTVWKKFSAMMFPGRLSAFVERNAYSKGPLIKGTSCEATVTIADPKNGKDREFKVSMEEVQTIRLTCFQQPAERMLKEKGMKALPELEISVLEIILKDWAADNLTISGKSCFFPTTARDAFTSLSERLYLKTGYFQSVCLGSKPYLNFDVSHKAFYNSMPVLQVMKSFYNRYTNALDEAEFNSFIRGVNVEYQLPNNPNSRMIVRANKLVGSAKEQTFSKDGTEMTVARYFETEKKVRLSQPDLPLLWVGPNQKSIYVPVEFCRILPDQVYRGKMDPREVREMVKHATTNAAVRQKNVCGMYQRARLNEHPLMEEFELRVATEMERVPARVLEPPELMASRSVTVRDGTWRLRDFLQPVTLRKWCILNADKQVRRETVVELQNQIKNKGKQLNMSIGDPVKDTVNVDGSFAGLKRVFSQLRDMELVFVIISEAKGLYSRVKTICETQEGVLTQCVKSRTVSQDPAKMATTVENILLKVNAKLGGKNLSLSKAPRCLDGYVMVVGADVTHASPGTRIPSVAAVAVSCDPAAFQYSITTRVQPKGEIIVDLKEIMGIHLRKFHELRKRYPEKIIIFRDGVSEGELPKVFRSELMAVKSACERLCQPKITFIVVQKRHHARFFPTRKEDEQGRNFNVPVGTCVDSQIVHPRDLDFYLVSHASILGTARPTRYRLLHDDSQITDDEIERLAFYLCHLFARCSRSVSYPSPTYNAHLAAFRARAYLEGLNITTDQDIPGIQKKMTDNISRMYPMFFV